MHITHWGVRATVTMAAMISMALFVILVVDPVAGTVDAISNSMALKSVLFFTALISTIFALGMQQEYELHNKLYAHLQDLLAQEKSLSLSLDDNRYAVLTYNLGRFRAEVTLLDSLRTIIYLVDESSIEVYQGVALEVPVHVTADGSYVGMSDRKQLRALPIDYKREMKVLINALKQLTPP
jgi:hypothetical protein